MEFFKVLLICSVLPAAVGMLMAVGSWLFELVCRHIEPLRAWHDREIRAMEAWQEDDEWTRY